MTAPAPAPTAGRSVLRLRLLVAAVALLLLVGTTVLAGWYSDGGGESAGAVATGEGRLEPGAVAPDFSLDTPRGTFHLAETRGEIVIVNFWATWCGPCRFEMPEFQELHATRAAEGIRIVAVNLTSADSRAEAERFADEFGLTFTIAFDEDGSVAERYGVQSLPATFFIDRAGVIRQRSYGPVLGERLDAALRAAGADITE